MMEAAYWQALNESRVNCRLCPINCTLKPGQTGPCGTRVNQGGVMRPLHYGQLVSASMDPIEKKPLYHFFPGRMIFSVAAPGCNLHCLFCQNWNISQEGGSPPTSVSPEQVVSTAVAEGSVGIAFTYSEPLVWFEFVRDTAREARTAGLKNVLVSNGFLNPEPLAEILPFIDAANIDLKAMDDSFYRKICKGGLAPVLAAIRQFHEAGVHLELTNLLIPGYNDADQQVDQVVDFVADLDPAIPLHFSAYRPAWKMEAPPTPRETLVRAWRRARERLDWVYLGNTTGPQGRDSVCPHCGASLVVRGGREVRVLMEKSGRCPGCGRHLPLVMA